MPVPSSVFTLLLLTADAEIQTQFRQIYKDAAITVARDSRTLQKDSAKRHFDVVIAECHPGQDLSECLPKPLDPSRTLLMTGSRSVLKKTAKMMQLMNPRDGRLLNGKVRDTSLEGYLEMKMSEFVKGMRNGSARNLHTILIAAVERPLITSALHETQGNQIQAAELLGLNRNTLRKKIADLRIPLKRRRAKTSRTV